MNCKMCSNSYPDYYVGSHPLVAKMCGVSIVYERDELCADCYEYLMAQKFLKKNERMYSVTVLGLWVGERAELPIRVGRVRGA